MNKKIIIIIVLVVAVLGFFAWKKGWLGGSKSFAATGNDLGTVGSDADLDNTNSICENLNLDDDERVLLKRWIRHITEAANNGDGGWSVAELKRKAKTRSITLHQQIVLSAAYQMYATGQQITEDRYQEIADEIFDM